MPFSLPYPLTQASYQANPYALYAELRERGLLVWEQTCAAWIVSRAEAVNAVLQSTDCVVRPPHEKVPKAIQGSAAGAIFEQLIRMNEGQTHQTMKAVLMQTLALVDQSQFNHTIHSLLHDKCLASMCTASDGAQLTQWTMQVPVRCMAMLLGFDQASSSLIANDVAEFVCSLSALSSAEQLGIANVAAERLRRKLLGLMSTNHAHSFIHEFQELSDAQVSISLENRLANLVGLLSQTYEACAGLLGNCLVQLHQRPEWRDRLVQSAPNYVAWRHAFVDEVARFDPAIQSTRRFVRKNCQLLGQDLREGELILVLLAAANRDSFRHPNADQFVPALDTDTAQWGFSAGRHRCPGQKLALTIVFEAVSYVVDNWHESHWQAMQYHYQESLNARIPVFTQHTDQTVGEDMK